MADKNLGRNLCIFLIGKYLIGKNFNVKIIVTVKISKSISTVGKG